MPQATFDRNESAGFLVNHLARIFERALAEGIRPLGLAPGQFMVLLELWREEGQTQRQLVERLDVEQATMANTLARMERDGLVVRRPHPVDGRAQSIHLTPRARGLEAPATQVASAVNRRMLRRLSGPSRGALLAAMRAIIADARPQTTS